ncbi:MAG TPA: formyltransferase family protein [Candidatus Eisenbacteria bacterium]|nr:formyltransferase family protein [Candidatus Eisenbacteria bacterium]
MEPARKQKVVYLGNLSPVALRLAASPGVELVACVFEAEDEVEEIMERLRGCEFFFVRSDRDLGESLRRLGPLDLGVIGNFGLILSKDTLAIPRVGFVNLHLGLLPAYPGRHPIRNALARGEPLVGVTLHRATTVPDAGPVLDLGAIAAGKLSPDAVFERLSRLAAEILARNLPALIAGH